MDMVATPSQATTASTGPILAALDTSEMHELITLHECPHLAVIAARQQSLVEGFQHINVDADSRDAGTHEHTS